MLHTCTDCRNDAGEHELSDALSADPAANRITRAEVKACVVPAIRSGVLGSFIGMLPGLSASVAAFLAYAESKRSSTPGRFGSGAVEGVASAESANNAVTGSAMIPMLALASHYAPQTPLCLAAAAELSAKLAELRRKKLAVLARAEAPEGLKDVYWQAAPRAVAGYVHELFASLRRLDALGCDLMLVEAPPAVPGWQGVDDRLRRAASG